MLCLLGVMLSVLCLVFSTPVPTACPSSSLFKETIQAVRDLKSKGSSEIVLLNKKMEARGNAANYLEGFIEALKNEALKNRKESVSPILHIVRKLEKIRSYGESCTGWMFDLKKDEEDTLEVYNFFKDLEHLLRFLGENADP
ncbi:hypothetical protein HGM15179_005027 [Zosterops borbonicus]|uniref:Uncharacterized protein n=1 Tax=Zosterops borbonicus TaxID=364589 RepID=A0A8K1GPW0_9PASS|nr:hypothetical protein HGM15179_005027 [Zosterops borbonicus]